MTKISDLVALTGANADPANDLVTVVDVSAVGVARNKKMTLTELRKGFGFRGGALATKAADETAANYSSFAMIPWTTETGGYDTDSFHDNVTNNQRLTIPAGVNYVRLGCNVSIGTGTLTSGDYIRVYIDHYNSANVLQTRAGLPVAIATELSASASMGLGGWSAPKAVSSGDYFVVVLDTESDTSITLVAAESWFAIEVLA